MKEVETSLQPRLVRALGPVMATAVVIGTVIGSGIFQKPQRVADNIPYFGLVALVWILGGLLALMGSLAYAEVAVLYPRAGGNYVFLREGYGRLAGFLWGWVEFWIIRSASLAALATLFTKSFYAVFCEVFGSSLGNQWLGYWPQKLVTVAVILGLALVNIRGVRWGGVLQLFITIVKVCSLLGLILLPFIVQALELPRSSTAPPRTENLAPWWPSWSDFHISGFISALLAVLWAYHGWMNIAPVAEEVTHPQRNIPLALLTGVGTLIVLYLGTNLSYSLVLTQAEMKGMRDPTPEETARLVSTAPAASERNASSSDRTVAIGYCRRLLGSAGVGLAAAAIMCSVFGALNGNLLVAPRQLYAMGQDGMAPRALGRIHPTYRTPAWAIVVFAVWASLLVLGAAALTRLQLLPEDKDHFDILTDFAMFGAVIFETMAVTSIFVFRRRYPDAPRPYRCLGYPVVPALYVILPSLILGNMFVKQRTEALIGVGFIALGALVYFIVFPASGPEAPVPKGPQPS
ncbi:MAG TPA: amino acid permease [Gemmataceae bacterium]|nr:amino acid permease [Gemmataceae bacterium]